MKAHLKRKLVAGVVTVAAVAGGGAAIAATQDSSPTATSSAIVSDAASQLGIQSSSLTAALKKAEENQIDAQVTAGTLTQTQADAIKAKIEAGTVPLVGVGRPGGPGFGPGGPAGVGGPGGNLDAAATYLGVTGAVLKTDLQNGKTLAQVATAQGKTVDGLVSALVTAAKSDLDTQVTAGNLTAAQEASIESDLTAHITDMVNGVRPAGGPGGQNGVRHGFRSQF
ncbi:MAG TPA: hypothetical protein VG652_08555 [Gaiellaceae bacterium]|nr:hypothetical protein [Gaiellaceae bacterium]